MRGQEDYRVRRQRGLFAESVGELCKKLSSIVYDGRHDRQNAENVFQANELRHVSRTASIPDDGYNDRLHGAVTEHAWINNPLLNIEKAIELQKLRREVRLRIILGRLSSGELNLLMLHQVQGLTPKKIAERTGKDVELIRFQLLIATRVVKRNSFNLMPKLILKINLRQRNGEDLRCSQPILGRWINDCDYPFLMGTLALTNTSFSDEFRGIRLSHEERKLVARTLEAHTVECARCGSKRAEDDDGRRNV